MMTYERRQSLIMRTFKDSLRERNFSRFANLSFVSSRSLPDTLSEVSTEDFLSLETSFKKPLAPIVLNERSSWRRVCTLFFL